ncbi:Methionyl-tRNA formyltransferase [Fusarium torreyae]|uniref:Methionyl-tRNA formyltransferase n=1 Tax=Fusarium torreyae TaxID=1237075 RepID=A0A9W8S5J6_9HYPO|nr:Methionyl-tRNA formyltransferase [Fusarium torreyae]
MELCYLKLRVPMLVQGLRDGVHVPPRRNQGWKMKDLDEKELAHAPKVTKADGHVDNWSRWTADEIARKVRVLGSVWMHATNNKGETKRLIFQDAKVIPSKDTRTDGEEVRFVRGPELGMFEVLLSDQSDGSCTIRTSDDRMLRVKKIKEEGKPKRDAIVVLKGYATRD